MIKPISPDDLIKDAPRQLIDALIEEINLHVSKEWDGRSAIVRVDLVLTAVAAKTGVNFGYVEAYLSSVVDQEFRNAGWDTRRIQIHAKNRDLIDAIVFKKQTR